MKKYIDKEFDGIVIRIPTFFIIKNKKIGNKLIELKKELKDEKFNGRFFPEIIDSVFEIENYKDKRDAIEKEKREIRKDEKINEFIIKNIKKRNIFYYNEYARSSGLRDNIYYKGKDYEYKDIFRGKNIGKGKGCQTKLLKDIVKELKEDKKLFKKFLKDNNTVLQIESENKLIDLGLLKIKNIYESSKIITCISFTTFILEVNIGKNEFARVFPVYENKKIIFKNDVRGIKSIKMNDIVQHGKYYMYKNTLKELKELTKMNENGLIDRRLNG